MTLPETDDEFETFLKRRTVLPNGMSDDDKLVPPKALDALVLKQAREAIRERRRLDRAPRWAKPVALAATILLCLSILLNVSLNTNRPTANLRRMTASTADSASPPASPATEGERREEGADGTSSREAILPEAKIVEQHAARPPVLAEANTPPSDEYGRANGSAFDKADALAKRSATAQAPREVPSATDSAADKEVQLADRGHTPAPGDAPSSAAGAAADRPAALAERRYAGTTAARAREPAANAPVAPPSPTAATAAPAPEQSARRSGGLSPAQSPSAIAAPSATASAQSPPPSAAPSAAPPTATPSSASGNAAPPATPPDDRLAEVAVTDQRAVAKRKGGAAAPPHPQDPKTWLAQIAALRAEGKTAQADAEMQRFRATFPGYPAKPDASAPSEPPK